jgi:hypothetical protein
MKHKRKKEGEEEREETKNCVYLNCERLIMSFIIPYLNTVTLQIQKDTCYFLIWFKNWAFWRHDYVQIFDRVGYHTEEILMTCAGFLFKLWSSGLWHCVNLWSVPTFRGSRCLILYNVTLLHFYPEDGGCCILYFHTLILPSRPTSLYVSMVMTVVYARLLLRFCNIVKWKTSKWTSVLHVYEKPLPGTSKDFYE